MQGSLDNKQFFIEKITKQNSMEKKRRKTTKRFQGTPLCTKMIIPPSSSSSSSSGSSSSGSSNNMNSSQYPMGAELMDMSEFTLGELCQLHHVLQNLQTPRHEGQGLGGGGGFSITFPPLTPLGVAFTSSTSTTASTPIAFSTSSLSASSSSSSSSKPIDRAQHGLDDDFTFARTAKQAIGDKSYSSMTPRSSAAVVDAFFLPSPSVLKGLYAHSFDDFFGSLAMTPTPRHHNQRNRGTSKFATNVIKARQSVMNDNVAEVFSTIPKEKKSSNSRNKSNDSVHMNNGLEDIAAVDPKQCTFEGCMNRARSRKLCKKHGGGKRCLIEGCNRAAQCQGKCPKHGGSARCRMAHCNKFSQSKGLCKAHGGGTDCAFPGCSKNAHQSRFCRSHGGGIRCNYFSCSKWAQKSGYCCAHTKLMGSATTSVVESTAKKTQNEA